MGKAAPNTTLDTILEYIGECDTVIVCSAEPASYAEATGTYDLATETVISGVGNGDFTIADDTYGRKLTMTEKSGITIDHSGDATHVVLCKAGDSSLRYVTTCTLEPLVAAGTVDIPAWKINIKDPT